MCAIVVRTRELERAEAEALLREQHVGAMAFAFRDRVAITLVNYVYRDPWIYARIEEGPDFETLRHNQWVAFEARAATGVFDWRTVTVNGSVEFLSMDGSPAANRSFHDAVAVVQSVVPAVFTEHDPFPRRVHFFRLHVDNIAGREARTSRHDVGSQDFVPPAAIGEGEPKPHGTTGDE